MKSWAMCHKTHTHTHISLSRVVVLSARSKAKRKRKKNEKHKTSKERTNKSEIESDRKIHRWRMEEGESDERCTEYEEWTTETATNLLLLHLFSDSRLFRFRFFFLVHFTPFHAIMSIPLFSSLHRSIAIPHSRPHTRNISLFQF